jgi:hypothetical protein
MSGNYPNIFLKKIYSEEEEERKEINIIRIIIFRN